MSWTKPNLAGYRYPHAMCACIECGEALAAQREIPVLLGELDQLDPGLATALRMDLHPVEGTAVPDLMTAQMIRGMVELRRNDHGNTWRR